MDFKLERDALIESTMAFARSIRPKSISDLTDVGGMVEQPLADTSKPIPSSAAITSMTWPMLDRDEIRQRVGNFRIHQEKFAREREDYYLQTRAKMLAGASND
jgi:hypothetical protein